MIDWTAIVRDHGPRVWQTAYRLLNHEADAADCYQRTFVAAFELAASEAVRDWANLLVRIASARALEQLRVRYRQAPRSRPLSAEPVSKVDAPEEAASASELAACLREALARIEPKQALVFCLICLEDKTNREAAMEMGIAPAYVGVLLQRARAALGKRLSAFDPSREPQS